MLNSFIQWFDSLHPALALGFATVAIVGIIVLLAGMITIVELLRQGKKED